jgi:hypothetical protein
MRMCLVSCVMRIRFFFSCLSFFFMKWFFIYSNRSILPKYGIIIMNRLRVENFVETITKSCHIDVMDSFLMYRNSQGDIYGFWLYEKKDRSRVVQLLKRLQEMSQEEEPMVMKPTSPSTPLGRTIDVASLFETARHHIPTNISSIPQTSISMSSLPPSSSSSKTESPISTRMIKSTLKHSLASLPASMMDTHLDKYSLQQSLIHLLQVSKRTLSFDSNKDMFYDIIII